MKGICKEAGLLSKTWHEFGRKPLISKNLTRIRKAAGFLENQPILSPVSTDGRQ
jgi:hypothetical protein